MKKIIIPLILVSYFTTSCNSKKPVKEEVTAQIQNEEKEHLHHDEPEELELNNGEKWKVDDEMMLHIRNIEKEVAKFSSANSKDYTLLANTLQQHLDLLTSNCTMTGKAHDELHKWLVPFLDTVSELSEEKNTEEAIKKVKKIEESFKLFNTFFI